MANRDYTFKVPDAPEKLFFQQDLTGTTTVTPDFTDWAGSGASLSTFTAALTSGTGTTPTIPGSGAGSPTIDATGLVGSFEMQTSGATAGQCTLLITGTFDNGEVKTIPATVIVA